MSPKTSAKSKPGPKPGKKAKKHSQGNPAPAPEYDRILGDLRKDFGDEAVMFLDQTRDSDSIPSISTGSLGLDHALGCGGFPMGRVIEVFGPPSSGKTTIALHALASAQQDHRVPCGFIDMEHAVDPSYAARIGVDKSQLFFAQPTHGEEALDLAERMVQSGLKMVVVDSVSALVPKEELESEIGKRHVGAQARMMSKSMRKLAGLTHRNGATLLFINQLRQKIGVLYGSPETTSGGEALKYYASVRVDIRAGEKIKNSDGEFSATKSKARVVKNKVAAPFREAHFQIVYGKGICQDSEILELGQTHGRVRKAGVWYFLEPEEYLEHLPEYQENPGQGLKIGQGQEQAKSWLRAHPEIRSEITAALLADLTRGLTQEQEEENLANLAPGSQEPQSQDFLGLEANAGFDPDAA